MSITLYQNKIEETVEYFNRKTGKTVEFHSAHELVQFLQEKSGKVTATIKVEQV